MRPHGAPKVIAVGWARTKHNRGAKDRRREAIAMVSLWGLIGHLAQSRRCANRPICSGNRGHRANDDLLNDRLDPVSC
jgi:hypothetical protein